MLEIVDVRPDKNIMDKQLGSFFDIHLIVNPRPWRTVMPAHLRIVPSRPGGGINLIAVQ